MSAIVDFISSVNKISLVAFVAVLGFLIYEFWLLRQEQLKKQRPTLPQFNADTTINKAVIQQQAVQAAPLRPQPVPTKRTNAPPFPISVVIVIILLFIGVTSYLMITSNSQEKSQPNGPQVIVQQITSPGLKIFTTNWTEIQGASQAATLLKPGTTVYLAIQTINEADIDRARIKVNTVNWNVSDITSQFNKDKNMYYKEYIIATGESKLNIDAQLHSASDGWLGD